MKPVPDPAMLHAKVAELYAYWRALPRPEGADLPPRAAFRPMDVKRLLPNIFLFAVSHQPLRFQFRLLGETIRDSGGPGRPGLFVDELPRSGTQAYLHDQLADVVNARTPTWYRGPPTLVHHREVSELEGIMLPLTDEAGAVSHILCLTVYHWLNGKVT